MRPITVGLLGANPHEYDTSTFHLLNREDFVGGLFKAAVFGLLLTLISCASGYRASGGAEGVGRASTRAVVQASLAILVADFLITKAIF